MKTSIILLDLTMTFKELESICNEYEIDFEVIKSNKVDVGVQLLWIDMSIKKIISYKLNGVDGIKSTNVLLEMNPVKPTVIPVVLEIDAILDKISQFGIKSLVSEELEYLQNNS